MGVRDDILAWVRGQASVPVPHASDNGAAAGVGEAMPVCKEQDAFAVRLITERAANLDAQSSRRYPPTSPIRAFYIGRENDAQRRSYDDAVYTFGTSA